MLRFISQTVIVSLLLCLSLLLLAERSSSAFTLGLTTVLVASVPAWSMIAGAVGATRRRKLRYSLGLLMFVLVFDCLAYLSGWQEFATGASVVVGVRGGALVSGYQLLLVLGPMVTLVLFVRKRPSVFWTSE